MHYRTWIVVLAVTAFLQAQSPTAPVINPRGITNLFTQQPAPARVAPGGLIQINGLNLGPVEGATAPGLPWPNQLGGTQVTINGRPAPIYSVNPGVIIVQVPWEVQSSPDPAEVIVRRAGAASRPARVLISAPMVPSIRTADDSGYGAPWGETSGSNLKLSISGIGQAEPRIPSGEAGPADSPAQPVNPVTAFVGGLRTTAAATASSKKPGEFDLVIGIPESAAPGDLITVVTGAAAVTANRTVYKAGSGLDVAYVPLPAGTPELRFLSDAGLNGRYLLATGARGDDGCFKGIAIDTVKKTATTIPDCLTSGNAALSPLVAAAGSDTVAALVGPPEGDLQTGVSSKVKIFSAANAPVMVELPAAASILAATQTDYRATIPETPPRQAVIDDRTGEVRTGVAGGGGGAGAGGGAAIPGGNLANFEVDGLKNIYANAVIQNRIVLTVGDDPLKPTKAKYAVLTPQGETVVTKDFPAGWLPLLPPQAPRNPNQPNQLPQAPPRQSFSIDLQGRIFYALARNADNTKHAFIAFAIDNTDPKLIALPDGWFATACSANMPVYGLDLSRRVAMMASKVPETEFKQVCTSSGFLLLDLAGQEVTAVALPVQAQVLVNASAEMNDYVYAAAYDSSRTNNTSDTLFVLDGVNGTTFALSIPPAISGFNVNGFTRIADINALVAPATRTVAGDQGLMFFSLDAQTATVLPVPDGFNRVAAINDNGVPCCISTRKLVARAFNGTASAGVVVYDLVHNDITLVPNPTGVTSIGIPAAAAAGGQGGGGGGGGGGQLPPGTQLPPGVTLPGGGGNAALAAVAGGLVASNDSANTVAAIAMNGERQAGIVVVRVP